MGNAESNVTSGIKKQTDAGSLKIYSLMDLKGGGELVVMMKEAAKTRDYSDVKTKIYYISNTEISKYNTYYKKYRILCFSDRRSNQGISRPISIQQRRWQNGSHTRISDYQE